MAKAYLATDVILDLLLQSSADLKVQVVKDLFINLIDDGHIPVIISPVFWEVSQNVPEKYIKSFLCKLLHTMEYEWFSKEEILEMLHAPQFDARLSLAENLLVYLAFRNRECLIFTLKDKLRDKIKQLMPQALYPLVKPS